MKKSVAVMVVAVLAMCSFSAFGMTDEEMDQIVNAQVRNVSGVNMYIIDAQAYANNDWRTVDYNMSATVADGVATFYPTIVKAKSYVAVSYFFGKDGGDTLFSGVTPFTVAAGETCQLHIRPEMQERFHYRFAIDDLPFDFDPQTSSVSVTIDGVQYGGWLEIGPNGEVIVNLWAPYDLPVGVEVIVSDANQAVAVQVSLNPLDVIAGNLHVPYVPSTTSSSLDITVEFVARQPVHVNGAGYASIDEALAATTGDVTIEVGEGQFDASFIISYTRKVVIVGQGADKTKFTISSDRTGGFGYLHDTAEGITYGGGETLELRNLSIENFSQYNAIQSAHYTQYSDSVMLVNCVVQSVNNSCVSTSYGSYAVIDHCIIVGSQNGVALEAGYASGLMLVTNSIVVNSDIALEWELSGSGFSIQNCCFWNNNTLANINTNGLVDMSVYTLEFFLSIGEDPKLKSDWHLSSDSPCLYRNIGIDWSGGYGGKGK